MHRLFFSFITIACMVCASVSVHAEDIIIWYDDKGNEHSVTMHDPGPLEQQVVEDKIANERDIPRDSTPGGVSDASESRSALLRDQYEAIKASRDIEQQRNDLRSQLQQLEKRNDAIDREMQEIRQEISHKRYRHNRIFSRNKNKRIHLSYEINQLENTLEQLAEMKKGVEVKKHALTTQLNSL